MMRVIPSTVLLVALFLTTTESSSSAQVRKTIRHSVGNGDTLDLLAAEYYGSRDHAIFIMKVNGMTHKRTLKKGEKLRIPISVTITTQIGNTLEGLAEKYLGDARRAPYLAEFNQLPSDSSLAAGEQLIIPFHVTHKALRNVPLSQIAAAYYGNARQAKLLKEYNFLDTRILEKGKSIVVPIYHVRVDAGKLPAPDSRSRSLVQRRKKMEELAVELLPKMRSDWRAGDFANVKRLALSIDIDFLPADLATQVGVLLGNAHVAFGQEDDALATYAKVLEREPSHRLSNFWYSPKILQTWERAGGEIKRIKQAPKIE